MRLTRLHALCALWLCACTSPDFLEKDAGSGSVRDADSVEAGSTAEDSGSDGDMSNGTKGPGMPDASAPMDAGDRGHGDGDGDVPDSSHEDAGGLSDGDDGSSLGDAGLDSGLRDDSGVLDGSADAPGVVLASPRIIVTGEDGRSDTMHVSLGREPREKVQFSVALRDATEGSLWPVYLAFDRTNWSTGIDVKVTGRDDDEVDHDQSQTATIRYSSGDPGFRDALAEVEVVNEDDDALRAVFDPSAMETHELGGSATVGIRLSKQPNEEVTVYLWPRTRDEFYFTRSGLHFTRENWHIAQHTQVVGTDDLRRDGDQKVLVQAHIGAHQSGSMWVTNRELSLELVTTSGPEVSVGTLSASGRYVVFTSSSSEHVPADTNGVGDVFVRDMATGSVERVSVASDGAESNQTSHGADISPDGRYVYFQSHASNLVAASGPGPSVYRRDRYARTTTRVPTPGPAFDPRLSANGAHLLIGEVGHASVYDTNSGTLERISFGLDGGELPGKVGIPQCDRCVSDDGRYVLFSTSSSTPEGFFSQLYLCDREKQQTRLLSATDAGLPSAGTIAHASMSGDGSTVLFISSAADLLTPPARAYTVISYDTQRAVLSLPLKDERGVPSDGVAYNASISRDGKLFAFDWHGAAFLPGYSTDIYLRHLADARTEPASLVPFGRISPDGPANQVAWVTLSANGRYVAFSTTHRLVAADQDEQLDLYVMQLP